MKKLLVIAILNLSFIFAYCDWNEDGTIDILDIVATVEYVMHPYEFPTSSFIAEPTGGIVPLEVTFTNTSDLGTGNLIGYLWDFGDGSTSIEEHPVYIYDNAGSFTASLTVSTTVGEDYSEFTIIAQNEIDTLFEMVLVPAGVFSNGVNDALMVLPYDFEIMKYEVTTTEYVAYLDAALAEGVITVDNITVQGYYAGDQFFESGNYEYISLDGSYSLITWNGSEFIIQAGYEDHPVIDVTWFGANAFAEYYGMRLPTDHEWEKTARGITGWDFAYGDILDSTRVNYWESGDPFEQGVWAELPQTTPVGFYNGQLYEGFQTIDTPSPHGAYDLTGNAWEWIDNWFNDFDGVRTVRGGCWGSGAFNLLSWRRLPGDPTTFGHDVGFRCVFESY